MKNSFAKRWLSVLLVLAICLSLAPAAFADDPDPEITLTTSSLELTVGGQGETLTASVSNPVNGGSIAWTSSNESAAAVSPAAGETVTVTPVGAGDTTITATYTYAPDGGTGMQTKTATCAVAVKDNTPPAPTVSLNNTSLSLKVGETGNLSATVANGSDATSVIWTTSDSSVVDFDVRNSRTATISAKKEGSATITATYGTGASAPSARCAVTVTSAPVEPPTIRKASPNTNSITIEKGSTGGQNITVVPSPADAEVKWKFSYTDSDGKTQESTTSDIVSLSGSGTTVRVTGQKPGRVDVIAYVGDGTGADQSVKLEVVVSGIVVDTSTIELKENERKKLPVPEVYGAAAVGGGPRFQANDSYIASVISDEVVGYTIGETQVVVTSANGAYKEYIPIKVVADPTTTIEAGTIGLSDTLSFGSSFMSRKFAEQLSGKVVSVTGLKVSSTDCGTLYYNYRAEAEPGPGVGGIETYYRNPGPGQLDLSRITFVPKVSFAGGNVEISYTATTDERETYACKIVLTVEPDTGSAAGIALSTPYNTAVRFDGDDFNRVCREQISAQLDYVTFSLPPVRQGSLYTDYVSTGNFGSAVTMRDKFSQKDLDDVWFVPAPGFPASSSSESVTVYYTAHGKGGGSYSGQVRIIVEPEDHVAIGGLAYDVVKGGVARFDDVDFNDYCHDVLDSRQTLSFVRFDSLPSSDQGVLYYDYRSASNTGSRVSAGTSYYYGTRTPRIDRLVFVPAENYTGTIRLPFTGQTTDSTQFTGNVEINVRGSSTGSGDIVLTCRPGKSVSFDDSRFNRLCRDLTNSTLNYIELQGLPNSADGTVYYSNSQAAVNRRYYNGTSYPRIDNLSFRASNRFSGAIDIPFVGTATSGETFYGIITIDSDNSGTSSTGDIHYYTDSKTAAVFKRTDFDELSQWETDRTINWVRFSVPNRSDGDLYRSYYSSTSKGSRITSDTTTIYASDLNRVAFIPAAGFTGTVYIDFTARATNTDEFSGTVEITVDQPSADVTVRYSTRISPISFRGSDFARSGYTLRSIRFGSMPSSSAGHLYYRYTSPTQYDRQASTGSTYNLSGSNLISDLSFIPKAGYTGTVTLPYTGTNTNGSTFDGEVIITVTASYNSAYFNDMDLYSNEQRGAVDYLYENGVTTGVGGGRYGPTSSITRGDFALMVYKAFGLSAASSTGNFSDVPSSAYYAQAVNSLHSLGIVNGVGNGRFGPNNRVTREDALIMVRQAMRAVGWSASDGYSSTLSSYSDGSTVSEYARGAVTFALQMGYLPTAGGRIAPREPLTRVDMAQILHRVLTT